MFRLRTSADCGRNQYPPRIIILRITVLILVASSIEQRLYGADQPPSKTEPGAATKSPADALSPDHWKQLDRTVDKGLKFLATQQEPNGSFKTKPVANPAITSFCVLAFLSRGHVPDQGPYGVQLHKAIDYVLSTQQPNGLLFDGEPPGSRHWAIVGAYNHAISGVMLSEVFGMADPSQQESIRKAIEKALAFTRSEQRKGRTLDRGGWRYLSSAWREPFADMSVTGWYLMFYRSARNAEFDVPEEHMNDAVAYVESCFDEAQGSFFYNEQGDNRGRYSRGVAGAGVLSLSLAGKHGTKMAQRAGQYILDHPFDRFNRGGLTKEDRFYYGAYYCSQAMYQLGGRPWEQFYPVLLKTMAENQNSDGSWDNENHPDDRTDDLAYSSSLAILSLTPPYQLLPIYQR